MHQHQEAISQDHASTPPIVLAAAAHPDDIEFMMAGTLLLLKQVGASIHMWNLANGCCGSRDQSRDETIRIRRRESLNSARLAGAELHESVFDDMAIFYDASSLARVAAKIREIRPTIILTHSPQDYMEDHQNVSRLIVSAAFARGMAMFATDPPRPATDGSVAIYHAMPHGLRDDLGRQVAADFHVDVASVWSVKCAMLAEHRSQKEWLDVSQGMDSYLRTMEDMALENGRMSGHCRLAEGWRRHNHLGFTRRGADPLQNMLAGVRHAASHQ